MTVCTVIGFAVQQCPAGHGSAIGTDDMGRGSTTPVPAFRKGLEPVTQQVPILARLPDCGS